MDDKKVIEGLEKWAEQEALKNRSYTDGMFYREGELNYFTVISDELREPDPSPVLLEHLATIFDNVAAELKSSGGVDVASNRLLQEFGLVGNNTVQKDKIMNLAMDRKTDKEITDYLHCNKNAASRALGTQKEPKEGTPRHTLEWLLNPGYVDVGEYSPVHKKHQKSWAEELLDETIKEALHFLNSLGGVEKIDVLKDQLTEYLSPIEPFCNLLVKPEKIRNHAELAIKQATKTKLINYDENLNLIKITGKGLSKLEKDILKSVPCLKNKIRKHTLPAINRALKKSLIKLSERNKMKVVEITEKGQTILKAKI